MPKDTKSKKTTNYYGCVYGGVMKQGYVYFFQTTEDPDEYFAQFKDYYGNKVRGRFVKASDDEDYLEKIADKLSDHQVHGKLYEVSVDTASKTLKELTGAKKASLLGDDETHAEEGAKSEAEETTKESKKVKVPAKASKKEEPEEPETKKSAKSNKAKKVESDDEDEEVDTKKSAKSKKAKKVESDEEPSEAESEEESEDEEEAPPKKSSKGKEQPKDAKKKDTKAKSSK